MACDPVVTDDVQITAELMCLYLYLYMLTGEAWGERNEISFADQDHEKHGPRGQQGVDVVDGGITWNTLKRSLFGAAATRRWPSRPLRFTPLHSREHLVMVTSNYITNGNENRFELPGQKHDPTQGEQRFPYDALTSFADLRGILGTIFHYRRKSQSE